ncbi:RadC family protein [Xenorhabdus doucetiae]|nr:DNA repair protein RadC [Xenorhabdus doucetiae]
MDVTAMEKSEELHSNLPPREKLLAYGAVSLTDAELLAIFLRTGTRGIPVVQMADNLLKSFGSLYHLLSADYADFCSHKGMGLCKYVQLQAISELAKRFFSSQFIHEDIMSSPAITQHYLQDLLSWQDREVFVVLFLTNQNKVICHDEMFKGTINKVEVHPREIVKQAVKVNAAAIILAHNHPSGNPEPSLADKLVTEKIIEACELVGVKVLDHIVIGKQSCVSFMERGWI